MSQYRLHQDDLLDSRGYIIAEFCCDTNVQQDVIHRLDTQPRLLTAARAVLARWDSPNWKDTAPTADVIAELRKAVEGCK